MPDTSHKDTIYASPGSQTGEFIFDQKVVDVFPDMIKRSVPGYSTIIHMIGQIAQRFSHANTRCYDLGCSLGAASVAMQQQITDNSIEIIAVDNSNDMITKAKTLTNNVSDAPNITFIESDITDLELDNASVIVLNFTLQFIAPSKRADLLSRIYKALNQGGVLVLSEKLAFDDEQYSDLMTELHHYFKKTNGYSDLEIAHKRAAIENVLIPETREAHHQRLMDVGFSSADIWFQCFNFASIVAVK